MLSAPSLAAVNLAGSSVIGLLAGLIAHGRMHENPAMRTFIFVGILGGFTTFSSLMLDSFTLVESGRTGAAVVNIGGQVAIGYMLAFVGFKLAG